MQAANTRQMMGAVEEAFKKWDITGDGAISKYELHAALTQLGMSEAQVVGRVPLGGVGDQGRDVSLRFGCWI